MRISPIITDNLIDLIRTEYQLGWDNVHGFDHWCRVRENGLHLADGTDADAELVELFAFFHDSQRWNDGYDPQHGERAAELVGRINEEFLQLEPPRLELLLHACRDHNKGFTEAPFIVQVCWDADRLDLARVGKIPIARKLCTEKAKQKDVIDWAVKRSLEAW